jgi:hypothetical protein
MDDRYTEDERWWTELLSSMGRTEEDIKNYFFGNAAKLLNIK